jgi:hypothetical protein
MRLSRPLVLVLCALAAGVLAPAAAAAKPASKRCAARNTTAVARSLAARVFERGQDDHVLVGCNRANGRRTVLASWFSCDCSIADESAPQVWLAGRHVAVNEYSCSPIDPMAPCTGAMRVFDLRTGRVRHSAETGGFIDLVLKPNGSVAYVLGQRLFRIDSRGSALLDEGPGIDSGSLAVNRTRVYWLHDNMPRTASLR